MLACLFARGAAAEPAPQPAPPTLKASVTCESPAAPGRFLCDLEVRPDGGTLSWADFEITRVADFLLPLRARLGPRDAQVHERDVYRWSFAMVARGRGKGDVELRVRGVVCQEGGCLPVEVGATGSVVVGG